MRKPMSCKDLVVLVTMYFEEALPRRDRKRFEKHIAGCPGCTAYLDQMRMTIKLTGTLTDDAISPAAEAVLIAAFRDWKQPR
ncbi:MAG: anti-sigma factor [Actinomycetota bacterium]|nr:zf-HC2 domain-containing protein [Actinomycetota bacterium]